MKKLFAALLLTALLMTPAMPASAATPNSKSVERVPAWNLKGNYTIGFDCNGCVAHYIQITSSDSLTQTFSGTGYYVSNPNFTWTVSGSVNGNQIAMNILYTGENPGYYVNLTGQLAPDGTMHGTAIDMPSQHFDWTTTSGAAALYATHGELVRSLTNKRAAAITNFGKPVTSQ